MSDVKLFRQADNPLQNTGNGAGTVALVNVGLSNAIGGGFGTFENCSLPWTVTYDELLFIVSGNFTLRVGEMAFRAGPGDTLWIPRGTELVYEAEGLVTCFYAVAPPKNSPSAGVPTVYRTVPPEHALDAGNE